MLDCRYGTRTTAGSASSPPPQDQIARGSLQRVQRRTQYEPRIHGDSDRRLVDQYNALITLIIIHHPENTRIPTTHSFSPISNCAVIRSPSDQQRQKMDDMSSKARAPTSRDCASLARLWHTSPGPAVGEARTNTDTPSLSLSLSDSPSSATTTGTRHVMDDILKDLNEAQRTAVSSTASVLQVLAPPGSGKTKTLTARVAFLIAHHRLKPWNIIVCTFTVKAANEMKERIRAFIGEELAKDLKLGTFHSIALRYLKHYGQHIGLPKDFGVADTSDSKAILKRIVKKVGSTMEPGQLLGRISKQKVKGSDQTSKPPTKNPVQQEFDQIFAEYEATLAASNLLDYDDLLLRCSFLLKTHPKCVSNVQAVLIDEFQDTNTIQYDLMGLFAQQQNTITIVGDPDQSIYGFRLAEIKNLARMTTQWPDTLTINLKENYRSSGAILHAAQKLIEQDESRPPKKLQATHTFGYRPVLRKLPSASAEAEWLVSEIKRTQALTADMLQPNDYAILLRSAALSRVIEAALSNAGMPYRMVGGIRFYDRLEIKLVLDYLRVIHQPDNSEAVERIINVPPRKIGEETVKKLREEAQKKGHTLWKFVLDIAQGNTTTKITTRLTEPARRGLASFVNVILKGREKLDNWQDQQEQVSVTTLINLVIQKTSLEAYLKQKFSDEESYEARWANIEELQAQAQEATDPEKLAAIIEADKLPHIDGLEQQQTSLGDALSLFLANIALTASAEQKAEESGEKIQQVTVSTIHAAKGLEWPVVYIPACYEGSIPHSRAEDTDEERRLLYVGMTRAQALLYLSCPIKNTQREETSMSIFLTEPGLTPFFEEHGPSLPVDSVNGLATTLKREMPKELALEEKRSKLEQDEDNYWPLNGEEPLQETAKWNYGRTSSAGFGGFSTARSVGHSTTVQQQSSFSLASSTMRSGFTSVAARYDELMEQVQLRKVDKRVEKQEKKEDMPKGRKRQLEGQVTLSSFLSKRRTPSHEMQRHEDDRNQSHSKEKALRDVSNTAPQQSEGVVAMPSKTLAMSTYRVSTKPMQRKPSAWKNGNDNENDDRYVFLSSSPPPPDIGEQSTGNEIVVTGTSSTSAGSSQIMRPASTFHTTSMDRVAPQRKTLGVRRSLHGWSARGKK